MSREIVHGNLDTAIELAVNRLGQRSAGDVASAHRDEQGRQEPELRGHDLAVVRRVEQLRALDNGAGNVLPQEPPAGSGKATPGFRVSTLLATALISAMAGAGAMRLAIPSSPEAAGKPSADVPAAGVVRPMLPQRIAIPARPNFAKAADSAPAPKPTDDEQVRELIETWRSAWADRNVDAYLASYDADFVPANGQARDDWAATRRKSISGRSNIVVATNGLTIERLDAQRMKVSFLQDYASGGYRETAQAKTLLVIRREGGWKIAGEWLGDRPAAIMSAR